MMILDRLKLIRAFDREDPLSPVFFHIVADILAKEDGQISRLIPTLVDEGCLLTVCR
jgi:hypothetical protein